MKTLNRNSRFDEYLPKEDRYANKTKNKKPCDECGSSDGKDIGRGITLCKNCLRELKN